MSDILIHSEPTPGQIIRDIHCWIATFNDGTEGIMAGPLPGLGMAMLCNSRRDVAEKLEPLARSIQRAATNVVSIRLVTFTTTEGPRQ